MANYLVGKNEGMKNDGITPVWDNSLKSRTQVALIKNAVPDYEEKGFKIETTEITLNGSKEVVEKAVLSKQVDTCEKTGKPIYARLTLELSIDEFAKKRTKTAKKDSDEKPAVQEITATI